MTSMDSDEQFKPHEQEQFDAGLNMGPDQNSNADDDHMEDPPLPPSTSVELEEGEIEMSSVQDQKTEMDVEDFSEPHPLNTHWTLYYTQPGKAGAWNEGVTKIFQVSTVEEFWGLFNNIPSVDQIVSGSDYNFFREDIFPGWEDENNKQGGRWNYTSGSHNLAQMSKDWLNSCLFAIGEVFEDPREICGIVATIKAGSKSRLSLWTRTGKDEAKTIALGKAWKKALGLSDATTLSYQSFCKGNEYKI